MIFYIGFSRLILTRCKTCYNMVQSKNLQNVKSLEGKRKRRGKREEAWDARRGEERRKERQREVEKGETDSRSAFAVERPPRGRDRRQKHRRLTSARNHSRADPGKIRPPIVYIEIRSCRNAPRGTISAPGYSRMRDENGGRGSRCVPFAWYSKKKPRAQHPLFFRSPNSSPSSYWRDESGRERPPISG